MSRLNRFVSSLIIIFLGSLVTLTASGEQGLDVDYAEKMPLASKSLLLDVTHYGDTLVAVGERGHILISADGSNWTQAEHVPTRSTLTSVFALGDRLWAAGHDAVILTSGDGGQTWTRQFFDPDRQQAIMDILFVDESNGIAVGSYGLFLRTTDGGQTWVDMVVDPESDYHLNKLLYFGDGKWLIAGEAGFSYRSEDDGHTWTPVNLPYQGSMWGAQKTRGDCALFYGLRGHIMESCDFGISWSEVEAGSEASISGSAVNNDRVLLAANNGTLLIRDDGDAFQVYHHSSGVDFSAAVALADGSFLLVGEGGAYRYPEPIKQEGEDE